MASDPVSRLQFARDEIDRVLGPGYAAAHPEVVIAVMQSAASDYAALAIARALQDVDHRPGRAGATYRASDRPRVRY